MQMVRIVATDDGTYTLYRAETALVTGLTREQAQELASAMRLHRPANC
jgi:hypothetical protein